MSLEQTKKEILEIAGDEAVELELLSEHPGTYPILEYRIKSYEQEDYVLDLEDHLLALSNVVSAGTIHRYDKLIITCHVAQ